MSNRIVAIIVVVMAAISLVQERFGPSGAPPAGLVEEYRRSIALQPGAEVEVASVGARVNVETADVDVAEIRVVRKGRTRADLARHRLVIDSTPSRLVVRAESPESEEDVQEVTLTVPRTASVHRLSVEGGCYFG